MVLKESDDKTLSKGDKAPYFTLPGVDGKEYSLQDIRGEKGTLIIFMCNHCPYVKPKMEEINRIARDFKGKGISVIGINPNESENYPEDSFENMKKVAVEKGFVFYYLHDESQETAREYGAMCTPDPFFFDDKLELIFHSRIDDTHANVPAQKHEMHEAIRQYLNEGTISVKERPSRGCSIKWKYE